MEERLIQLEMLYSNQTQMLDDLSAELFKQQLEIKRLSARVQWLEEKLAVPQNINGGHERPPHY
ncbi:MAG: SlyX family protein [Kiritimatiellaceae bacterium]|nr:SlyX family protein [Kiritimatiellaceae bacterium]